MQALYDYVATSGEELDFKEGDVIKVVRTDDNGVDDGFWEGMLNGQRGVFPSLVVEEIPDSAPSVTNVQLPEENVVVQGNPPLKNAGDYVDLPSEPQKLDQGASFVKKRDDYIELPPDYKPGVSGSPTLVSGSDSAVAQSQLQPARPAPPVPRMRCRTENVSSMKKPDAETIDRPNSRELNRPKSMCDVKTSDYVNTTDLASRSAPNASTADYMNYSEFPSSSSAARSAKSTADYVNTCDLPNGSSAAKVNYIGSTNFRDGASTTVPLAMPPPSQGSSPRFKRSSSKPGPPKPPPPSKKPTVVKKIPTSNV